MSGQPQPNQQSTASPTAAQLWQRQSYDPILTQHKQWQTVHLFQVNIKDNPFHPLDVTNGPWKQSLGRIGGVLGAGIALWAVSQAQKQGSSNSLNSILLKTAATKAGEQLGSIGLQKIGFLIDNADSIIQNIDTTYSTPPENFEDLNLSDLVQEL